MNIVLYRPEIPQNTGNIARTCASTGARLHLIHPLGFAIDNAKLKRAGLDYWHQLDITHHDSFESFLETERLTEAGSLAGTGSPAEVGLLTETGSPGALYALTTRARRLYSDAQFNPKDYLLFGQETAGLPECIRQLCGERCLRVPMTPDNRSLNLSNTVALVLYEALRQQGFVGLS